MYMAGRVLLYFLAAGVAAYAALAYGLLPLGAVVHPDMKPAFLKNSAGIYAHVTTAIFALALGPFQFSHRLRRRHVHVHRWLGRLYLGLGVLAGGLSGLYISQFAFGGPVARLGFTSLAICWLFTGFRAFVAARQGEIEQHRKWMIRNFSLTFAAVTLRIYVPLSALAGIDFAAAYSAIAWLCWIPNLLVAERCFNVSSYRTVSTRASG